jgi:hypothetical protein
MLTVTYANVPLALTSGGQAGDPQTTTITGKFVCTLR